MTTPVSRDFMLLSSAINDTIQEFLGRKGLKALLNLLRANYDVTVDELSYRTETLYHVLETSYGIVGPRTIGVDIARKMYSKLGLTFHANEGFTLVDYVQEAKSKFANQIVLH